MHKHYLIIKRVGKDVNRKDRRISLDILKFAKYIKTRGAPLHIVPIDSQTSDETIDKLDEIGIKKIPSLYVGGRIVMGAIAIKNFYSPRNTRKSKKPKRQSGPTTVQDYFQQTIMGEDQEEGMDEDPEQMMKDFQKNLSKLTEPASSRFDDFIEDDDEYMAISQGGRDNIKINGDQISDMILGGSDGDADDALLAQFYENHSDGDTLYDYY